MSGSDRNADLAPVLYVLTGSSRPADPAGRPPAARTHPAPAARAPGRWLGRRWRAAGAASAADAPTGTLLCVSRLVSGRGLERLITAFGLLADDRPGLDLELAGGGPLEDALRAQVRDLGLEDRVRFLGPLPFPAEQEALRRCTALVLPRRTDEPGDGPATVLLEAMAGGTPVVTTDVLGLPEPARHRAAALLVAPHDAAGLALAVVAVLEDPAFAGAVRPPARHLTARPSGR